MHKRSNPINPLFFSKNRSPLQIFLAIPRHFERIHSIREVHLLLITRGRDRTSGKFITWNVVVSSNCRGFINHPNLENEINATFGGLV